MEGRVRELEAAARAKTELEGDLQTARKELQHATGQLAAERSASEAVRRDLESRTHELQTASSATSNLEAKLKAARAEMRQAAEAQASKRSGWEAARRTLETTLKETRAELQRVVETHGVQTAAWETARQELEARVHDREAIVRAKTDLEARVGVLPERGQRTSRLGCAVRTQSNSEARLRPRARVARPEELQSATVRGPARKDFEARLGDPSGRRGTWRIG